ncbi:MAG: hypothetical protein QF629_04340 [Alphaproteobacteria bacterium]|jgi:hypothetical protein|nr:hypothetical protein [Alphaproteobacteria bacterium]MDP6238858.1 hypothetical protein [Alphaproteobacteria bacterium]MDP7173370.1 hypothetical protein [Alphaproteobacteria bacterium]MDP7233635.1 hypothetical protein [Alphaproteobacteria bacterium]MDP7487336.1 hypothetical protein [Alphaproteobacteria bacterium]|tara:strand:+ start:1254 stop:1391 length:138 start_codon:yes stop_codon:yes gene_type:complete
MTIAALPHCLALARPLLWVGRVAAVAAMIGICSIAAMAQEGDAEN